MKWECLIVDCDEEWNDRLADLLYETYPQMSIRQTFSKEEGIEATNEKSFHLIILDPFIPASVEGRYFVEKIKQFYSINKDTPIIVFTDDIDYVSDLTSEFGIHPETKLGPIEKILNPVQMNLNKILKSA
jgi:DNA-binding response OmpR family regulator